MKNKKIIMCLSTLLVISLITTGCGKEIEVKNGSKVAVSVKGDKFTATEYYNKIKEDNVSELIEMIDESILNKKYKSNKEEKEAIEKQIEQIKSYYGGNDSTFKSIIKQSFGVESEKELKEVLRLEYRRNEAVKDYILKHITKKEINKYYKNNVYGEAKASHILITTDIKEDMTDEEKEKAEKKALKEAKKIIKSLNDGEDFAKLAKKHSKDESNASNGGDLGYFSLDDMVDEFSDAVKDLKVKEYTKEPVKTEYGYHIILKTGQKDKPALKKVKKDIKEKIRDKKMEESATIFYETLMKIREENKIKWNDDTLKKAYNDYMDEIMTKAKENAEKK